jgi:hypothetical protein
MNCVRKQLQAAQCIKNRGQLVEFKRVTVSSFDPAAGTGTETELIFTAYGIAKQYRFDEIDGVTIQAGDLKLTLEASTTPPIIGDCATVDSVKWRLMALNPVSPAGVIIRYELQLRL